MNYSHYGERLAPLIDFIYKIDSDNAKPEYMKILKKASKIALEEKQWDAYLIVCYHTLYLVSGYRYDVEHCINHCADFLRFLTNHADEAIEQSINPHYHKTW